MAPDATGPTGGNNRDPEEILWAEVVDESSPSRPDSGSPTHGPTLWVPGWLAAACALCGVVLCWFVIVHLDLGAYSLGMTALLVVAGIGFSIGGLVWPRYVNGRRGWVLPLLGLLGSMGTGVLLLITLFFYTYQDEIREAAEVERAARKREEIAQRQDELARAQRDLVRRRRIQEELSRNKGEAKSRQEKPVERLPDLEERRRRAAEAKAQRERLAKRRRDDELRRQRELRVEQLRIEMEERRIAAEAEARQALLETFSTGAADELNGGDVINYRDNPSVAESTPLRLKDEVRLENASIVYLEAPFTQPRFAPPNGRVYALRHQQLLAIDPQLRMIVRRLPLPFAGSNLVVTSNGPALRCGRRVLLVDWDLRPLRSAPAADSDALWGHPRSPFVFTQQIEGRHHRFVRVDTSTMGPELMTTATFSVARDRSLAAFDDPSDPSGVILTSTAATDSRLSRISLTGSKRRWLPTSPAIPVDPRPTVNGSIKYLGPQAVAVCYSDASSPRISMQVFHGDGFRLTLSAMISAETPPGSPYVPSATRGERVYLRQAPRRILTWVPGTNRFDTFDLDSNSVEDGAVIQSLTALDDGVWAQISGHMAAIVRHDKFATSATRDLLLAPHLNPPAQVEEYELPQGDWLEALPSIPLRTMPMWGGLVKEIERRDQATLYKLARPAYAVFDTERQRLVLNVRHFGLVSMNPKNVLSTLYAAHPSELESKRPWSLTQIAGHAALANRSATALIDNQMRQLVPFSTQYCRGYPRSSVFCRQSFDTLTLYDFRTGKSYRTFTGQDRASQIKALGFDTNEVNVRVSYDFVEDQQSAVWLYLAYGKELFRARLPAPGTEESWQLEHVLQFSSTPLVLKAYPRHLVSVENTPSRRLFTARIYQTVPEVKLLYERNDVGREVSGWGGQFYMGSFASQRDTHLIVFNAVTGDVQDIPLGHRSITHGSMVPFPGGVMLCSSGTPLIVKLIDD